MIDMILAVGDRHVYVPETRNIRRRAIARNAMRTEVDRYVYTRGRN